MESGLLSLGGAGGYGRGGWICNQKGESFIVQCSLSQNTVFGGEGCPGGEGNCLAGTPGAGGGSGGPGFGGAVFTLGTASIHATELSDNHATGSTGGVGAFGGYGIGANGAGGAAKGGAIHNAGELIAINSSVVRIVVMSGTASSSTQQDSAGVGGGINNASGNASLINCTIAVNDAIGATDGGGNIANDTGKVMLINSIVANSPSGRDVSGAVVDGGHNLSSDSTSGFTALSSAGGIDPKLGLLADYGGPTRFPWRIISCIKFDELLCGYAPSICQWITPIVTNAFDY